MRILYNGKEVGYVVTNHSITPEEALYCGLGIDINDSADCERAYEEKQPFAYLDDEGNYQIDVENMEIIAD